jgi:membrane protease YdiL (CAAX protease family)
MPDFLLAALLSAACLLLLGRFKLLAFVEREVSPGARRATALFLLWAILLLAVFQPTAASRHVDAGVIPDVPFPLLFVGHALLCAFLFLWWRLSGRPPLRSYLSLQTPRRDDWILGLRFGVLAWVLGIAASSAVGIFTAESAGAGALPEIPPAMAWLAALPVAEKLLTVAVAMTVEEAFFRGFLQPRIGWLPSSLLFALGHAGYGIPRLVASVFVVSLVLGQALRRSGRLWPCVIAHGLFDAAQLLVIIPLAVRLLG